MLWAKYIWVYLLFPLKLIASLSIHSVFLELNPAMGALVLAFTGSPELIIQFWEFYKPFDIHWWISHNGITGKMKIGKCYKWEILFYFIKHHNSTSPLPNTGLWAWDILTYSPGRENSRCLFMVCSHPCLHTLV